MNRARKFVMALVVAVSACAVTSCGELQIQGPDVNDSKHIIILCAAVDTVWLSPRPYDYVVCESFKQDTKQADTTSN